MKAITIASYFVEKANAKTENDLTNLKLQKILYLAQGERLGLHGADSPLFEEPIEAWQYGPVVRDIYNAFATCGASPITLLDLPDSAEEDVDASTAEHLDAVWDKYGIFSASYLVDMTHRQAPWKDNYQPSSKNTIPVGEMATFFAKA